MFLQKLYFCGEFAMDHLDELREAMKYDEREWKKQTSISNDWLEGILGVAEPPEKQIYERLAAQNDCTYVHGSLCELDIIRRKFAWNAHVDVFAIKAQWRRSANSKVSFDKAPGDNKATYMQTLDDHWFYIAKDERASLLPRKPSKRGSVTPFVEMKSVVRDLKRFIKYQLLIMRGAMKPWEQRADDLHKLLADDFVQRYFFEGNDLVRSRKGQEKNAMTGCRVEKSYLNLNTKCVLLDFAPCQPSPRTV